MFLVGSTLTTRLRPYGANALLYGFACLAAGFGVFVVLGLLSGGLGLLVLIGLIPLALLLSIPGGVLSVAMAPRIAGTGWLRVAASVVSFVTMGILIRGLLGLAANGTHEIDPNPIALVFPGKPLG